MKLQVRLGTFETNSSSQHTLAILNNDEYEQLIKDGYNPNKYWKDGKYIDLVAEFDRMRENNLFRPFEEKEVADINSDEDKIQFMLKAFDYRDDYKEEADVIEKEVMGVDGNILHIISRYSWDY